MHPLARLLKEYGAKRVSPGAAEELSNYLEMYGRRVSAQAVSIAEHSGRATVLDKDVQMVLRMKK